MSNVDGENSYVRVQVLTNAGALDRDKQLAVVSQFTGLITAAAADASVSEPGRGSSSPKQSREGGALRVTHTPTPNWSTPLEHRSLN